MIWIRVNPNDIPKEWLERAQKLADELANLPDDTSRSEFLKNHAIWSEMKETLLRWSHNKCWYSEAKELVSDYHVDHFRPKNRALDLKGNVRRGYWWLAYDWQNYFIAGAVCNSPHKGEQGTQGKWDYFPLRDESLAATCKAEISNEEPYLLDPTSSEDVALLDFDERGKPFSAVPYDSWATDRVRETVRLLHLDYPTLEEARREKWKKCRILIDRINTLLSVEADRSDPLRRNQTKDLMRDLRDMASPQEPLSATVRACLLKSNLAWAQNLAVQAVQIY